MQFLFFVLLCLPLFSIGEGVGGLDNIIDLLLEGCGWPHNNIVNVAYRLVGEISMILIDLMGNTPLFNRGSKDDREIMGRFGSIYHQSAVYSWCVYL